MNRTMLALVLVAGLGCEGADDPKIAPDTASASASTTAGVGGAGAGGAPTSSGAGAGSVSGTRLRARSYVGDDGSRQFIGWHDQERSEDCNFRPAADGKVRCLPDGAAVGSYFSDAGCTEPLAYAADACGAPKLALQVVPVGCTSEAHVYQLGGKLSGVTVYTGPPAFCSETPDPAEVSLFSIGAEVPASAFVEATVAVE